MKNNKKYKIFIAIDTNNISVVRKIMKQMDAFKKKGPIIFFPKFGLQFFYSKNGRNFLKNFKREFFLDIKAMDVKQTVVSAIESLKDIKKIRWITINASCGLETLKAAHKKAKEVNKNLKVLVVSVLTNHNNITMRELGHTKTIKQIVLKRAALTKKSGCEGIIASAEESKIIKKKFKKLFVVTPGIRLPGDKKDEQTRVVSPRDALIKKNADAIVIGRSVTRDPQKIKNNLKKLIDHLKK